MNLYIVHPKSCFFISLINNQLILYFPYSQRIKPLKSSLTILSPLTLYSTCGVNWLQPLTIRQAIEFMPLLQGDLQRQKTFSQALTVTYVCDRGCRPNSDKSSKRKTHSGLCWQSKRWIIHWKAHSEDNVIGEVLKMAWKTRIFKLLQSCVNLGYHPMIWKEAIIMMILKPDKSGYTKYKAYIPISLLKVTSKVLKDFVEIKMTAVTKTLPPPKQFWRQTVLKCHGCCTRHSSNDWNNTKYTYRNIRLIPNTTGQKLRIWPGD